MKTNYEPITCTPHFGDRLRDAYWAGPTKFDLLGLAAVGAFIAALSLAVM